MVGSMTSSYFSFVDVSSSPLDQVSNETARRSKLVVRFHTPRRRRAWRGRGEEVPGLLEDHALAAERRRADEGRDQGLRHLLRRRLDPDLRGKESARRIQLRTGTERKSERDQPHLHDRAEQGPA